MSLTRPLVRYHGGKWRLAPWIISFFPAHLTYVEPYGGAASVLLRKERSYAEVYNDLDHEMVNVFRVLRDRQAGVELLRQMSLTPFAREEFALSWEETADPIDQARRTLFRFAAGFSTGAVRKTKTGFRNNVTRSGSTPAGDWMNLPAAIAPIIERLRGVVIEQKPALEVIKVFDRPDTLLYVDPPYMPETRNQRNAGNTYRHEMTDEQHVELAGVLRDCKSMVVLSGYACPLYAELYHDWQRVDRAAHADGAKDRVESLWLKPNTQVRQSLFSA